MAHFEIKHLGMGDVSITPTTKSGTKKLRSMFNRYSSSDNRLFMEGNALVIVHEGLAENLCNYFESINNQIWGSN